MMIGTWKPDRLQRLVAVTLLTGMLAACSAEPFEYTAAHEIPPGPGLISGETGEFELYRKNPDESENQDDSAE